LPGLELRYFYRIPIKLRYDDGLYGLEYIQINPSVSASYDIDTQKINSSANLDLSADFMIFYNLPISFETTIPLYNSQFKFGLKTSLSTDSFLDGFAAFSNPYWKQISLILSIWACALRLRFNYPFVFVLL